jgi:hypothetical protein
VDVDPNPIPSNPLTSLDGAGQGFYCFTSLDGIKWGNNRLVQGITMTSGPAVCVDKDGNQHIFYRDAGSPPFPGGSNNGLLHEFSTDKGQSWQSDGPDIHINNATVQVGTSPAVVFTPANIGRGGPLGVDRIIVLFLMSTGVQNDGLLSTVYGRHK